MLIMQIIMRVSSVCNYKECLIDSGFTSVQIKMLDRKIPSVRANVLV